MNYIIVDVEATCWEERSFEHKNEIIEIGAVIVSDQQENISEFECFVKPLMNPVLSEFCKQLTTITQQQVDTAPYFNEVITKFRNWITFYSEEFLLCSWGFYDKKQFNHDCQLYGLETNWLNNHISLKHQYAKINHLRRAIGMENALLREQIPLTGTHHRSIDDAKNITKIFLKYFYEWSK